MFTYLATQVIHIIMSPLFKSFYFFPLHTSIFHIKQNLSIFTEEKKSKSFLSFISFISVLFYNCLSFFLYTLQKQNSHF